ncbi:hypothetical protein SOQ14_04510 [Erythrobacter sp. T5W1-R]|uniref:hypothetical protein n=1 Tax=Erythrobacter sp. T5W1-R TaxID=3101752 RepID=UPI002AFF009D|nr:hypothetical protein [Erythrobacter sp. T5W1-R]MEA1618175.1 hypothetical protein [Erythrobacter sp. T5W1-R]
MKKAIGGFLLSPEFQRSLLAPLSRWALRKLDPLLNIGIRFKMDMQLLERGHYAYCMMNASILAKSLGHSRISAIEFGVAGGNGLKFMCDFAEEVQKATGVTIECYGFDTGGGMPPPDGAKDLPYWFQSGQYKMDVEALKARVPNAKLVLGEIRDTLPDFIRTHNPAPIGAIFNDTDYWSSTRDSLIIFDIAQENPEIFLPRIFVYLDDIIGSEIEMYGPYNGQLLAIEEYNERQDSVKLHLNQNLLNADYLPWRWQIYYAHLFKHPQYEKYVGAARQGLIESALRLRS